MKYTDYTDIVASRLPDGWQCQNSGELFVEAFPAAKNIPDQGWKIRVNNSCLQTFASLLSTVATLCVSEGIAMKFARSPEALQHLFSKGVPTEIAGKALTLYPPFDTDLVDCIEKLEQLIAPLDLIPCNAPWSDRRLTDNISYRYGSWTPQAVVRTSHGTFRDRRDRYLLPPGIVDPFGVDDNSPADDNSESVTLNDYTVTNVIQRNWGGSVYGARKNQTAVILKEARPDTRIGCSIDADAKQLLQNEYRVLNALRREQNAPIAPRPIDIFEFEDHLFLVTERIDGHTLYDLLQQPVSSSQCHAIARHIANTLYLLHNDGKTAHLDVSVANIMVSSPDTTVTLIDFELARQNADDEDFAEDARGFAEVLHAIGEKTDRPNRYKDAILLAEQGGTMTDILGKIGKIV